MNNRVCGRCGADVGALRQCPRCAAPLAPVQESGPFAAPHVVPPSAGARESPPYEPPPQAHENPLRATPRSRRPRATPPDRPPQIREIPRYVPAPKISFFVTAHDKPPHAPTSSEGSPFGAAREGTFPAGGEEHPPGSRLDRLRAQRGRFWRRWPVLAALAVSVLAIGLAGWLVAGRSPQVVPLGGTAEGTVGGTAGSVTAPPAPSQQQGDAGTAQAAAVDHLLSGGGDARSGLKEAVAGVSACRAGRADTLQKITGARRDQLAAARLLEVGDVPGGAEVKRTLVRALDLSYQADAAFLSWARRYLKAGCKGPIAKDRDYSRGVARSKEAEEAKTLFVTFWRPVAEAFGLTPREVGDV
ncbi:hypothetical protein ABZ297_29755 [Nonomuraea sp. NPDC005983]|uniref:hypothetical protein n=1 Tax=Nonomuraea sp. NPDC005983 TaxID=3155595 RepID=UPI0033B32C31